MYIKQIIIRYKYKVFKTTILPNTGTRLIPDYFCLIPEQIVLKAEQIVYRFKLLHSRLITSFRNISALFWNRFAY